MFWIGILNTVTNKVDVTASAGKIGDYLDNVNIDMSDKKQSAGPTGRAVQSGTIQFSSFIQDDSKMTPWRERALALGFKSSLALPLKVFGKVCGVFTLYSGEVDFFNDNEIRLLEKLANNLSFAIEFIENEEERKITEEALKNSETRLKLAVSSGLLGIWDWSVKENVMVWDDRMFELYGIKHDTFTNNIDAWMNGLHPEDKQRAIDECNNALYENKEYNTVFRVLHPDGKVLYLKANGLVIKDYDGKPIRMLGINSDITDQKRAEEALKESEERMRLAIENSPVPIMIHDEDDNVLQLSKGWTKNSGYTIEDIPTLADWTEKAYGERTGFKKDYIDKLFEINKTEYNGEWIITAKDGSKRIWDFQTTPLGKVHNGKRVLHSMAIDITDSKKDEAALRESEKKLRSILENTDAGYFFIDKDGIIQDVNNAWVRLYGYDSADEIIGHHFVEIQNIVDVEPAVEFVNGIMKNDKKFLKGEFSRKVKDGSIGYHSFSANPVVRQGEVIGIEGFIIDTTEKRKVEDALMESETNFRSLFENMTEGVALHEMIYNDEGDPVDYRIIDVNCAYEKFTQISRLKAIGVLASEIYGIDTPPYLEEYYQVVKTKIPYFFETHFQPMEKDFSISVISPKADHFATIFMDITERKNAEETLRENEERFRRISNIISDIAYSCIKPENGTYHIDWMNGAAVKITGYTIDEIIAMECWGKLVIKDDIQLFYKNVIDLSPGDFSTCELRLKNKNGDIIWVKSIAECFINESQSNIKKLFGGLIDITDRKKDEEALKKSEFLYRTLFENMLDGFIHSRMIFENDIPIDYEVLNVNPAYEIMTGLKGIVGRKISEVIPNYCKDNPESLEVFGSVAKTGIPRRWEHYLPNLKRWFSFAIYSPFKDEFVCVFDNITERKHAEELLQEQNFQLEAQYEEYMQLNEQLRQTNFSLEIEKAHAEESDKLKTAFLQNMSHEIRTPLNGIIGFSNLLQDDDLSGEDIKEFTGIIKNSGNRLIEIVNNVLDISKIETGQMSNNIRSFSINSMMSDLYSFFSPQTKEKEIKLNYHTNLEDDNCLIDTDDNKLNQIFTNLINNAIKFTKSGSIDFGYKIRDNELLFYVKDTGIGIPEEFHERIFGRFTQADLSITRGYEGAGLGLAICKGLVGMLGGRIWLESENDIGSTFFFTIPLNFSSNINTLSDNVNKTESNQRKIKILIAEDDSTSFQYFKRVLKNEYITILSAENGKQAVDIVLNDKDIDLILMDIRMPVMDGLEATRQIKGIRPDLPIIAQTAYAFSEEKDKFLSIGCDDYIMKPIDKDRLLKMVEKYRKGK